MKTITLMLTVLLLSNGVYSIDSESTKDKKLQVVTIKTSSQCNDCKERIEEALAFEKGVKKSELDVETHMVTVSYKKGKTTPEKIRKAITKAGYDADDVKADPKAYGKLPACCKKPDDPDAEPHN